jgi:hypothetical protein
MVLTTWRGAVTERALRRTPRSRLRAEETGRKPDRFDAAVGSAPPADRRVRTVSGSLPPPVASHRHAVSGNTPVESTDPWLRQYVVPLIARTVAEPVTRRTASRGVSESAVLRCLGRKFEKRTFVETIQTYLVCQLDGHGRGFLCVLRVSYVAIRSSSL